MALTIIDHQLSNDLLSASHPRFPERKRVHTPKEHGKQLISKLRLGEVPLRQGTLGIDEMRQPWWRARMHRGGAGSSVSWEEVSGRSLIEGGSSEIGVHLSEIATPLAKRCKGYVLYGV